MLRNSKRVLSLSQENLNLSNLILRSWRHNETYNNFKQWLNCLVTFLRKGEKWPHLLSILWIVFCGLYFNSLLLPLFYYGLEQSLLDLWTQIVSFEFYFAKQEPTILKVPPGKNMVDYCDNRS